jgi:tetratricopeptide (TPR) repeat protein
MKKQFLAIALLAGGIVVSGNVEAQKKNVTSATLAYKNSFVTNMQNQKIDAAKTAIFEAKEYVDEASKNEETANDPKMFWIKGTIYSNIYAFGNITKDSIILKDGKMYIETALEAFKKGYDAGSKYQADIKSSIREVNMILNDISSANYSKNDFKTAANLYSTQYELLNSVGVLDSASLFNYSLCAEKNGDFKVAAENYLKLARIGYRATDSYILANSAYRQLKELDKAKEIIVEARTKYPDNKDLLLQAADTYISANDPKGAEQLLNEALANDPNNKILHLNIGLVYMDLGQNEKAEQEMLKALEIDPNYEDGLYQVGAHLVNWAREIQAKADALSFKDPKVAQYEKEATEKFQKATTHLEKYISIAPNDKSVLTILAQIYTYLGNSEKAADYKKRAE